MVTGGDGEQQMFEKELRALTNQDRDELMHTFQTPVSLGAQDVLALKASLQIPWNKLRAMRRYTK